MSSASGASARWVIVAREPSTKNSTAENSATPSVTPASEASVRRGLRTSSRQTYLSTDAPTLPRPADVADEPSVAKGDGAVHPRGHLRIVRHDDERRAGVALGGEQEVDDRGRVVRVQ